MSLILFLARAARIGRGIGIGANRAGMVAQIYLNDELKAEFAGGGDLPLLSKDLPGPQYQAVMEVSRRRMDANLRQLALMFKPDGKDMGRLMKATAEGAAQFSKDHYLRGQRLNIRTRRLYDSVRGIQVPGGRAAVVAGGQVRGKQVFWALPHEVGGQRYVTVKAYYRRRIGDVNTGLVSQHQRFFSTPAKWYLRDGVRYGQSYMQAYLFAEFIKIQRERYERAQGGN